jgi:hypothetical protein
MPVSIRKQQGEGYSFLASLGDGEWSLAPQIGLLESWMDANAHELPPGEYVADVGFCWRKDAAGGGAALGMDFLKKMADGGFSLFLSEYPGFTDDEDAPEEATSSDSGFINPL